MRLLVVSHTPHYIQNGQVVGWGPTIRELDYLSGLFDELVHLAPLYPGSAPASALGYQSERIRLHAVKPSGGNRLIDKWSIGAQYPAYTVAMLQELKQAEVVHVRCPANISLLAILLLTFVRRPSYRWVKYAGAWQPTGKEPISYRLQRWWLQKGLHKGIVTVNGSWPDQPNHIYSFPNPCLTSEELREGQLEIHRKTLQQPVQLLFIGRLETSKGAGRVLEIASLLASTGVEFQLKMIGDGPARQTYESLINKLALNKKVSLLGWLPQNELYQLYAPAHFILHPSESEGWPKVLSEGMAYGVVPLAGAVSSIPQILAESQAGLALLPNQVQDYANAIQRYLAHPGQWKQASLQGIAYASNFSYERYLRKVQETFQIAWDLKLPETTLADKNQKAHKLACP